MVVGPIFGPHSRFEKVAVFVAALAIVLVLLCGVFGCSTHSYLYRPVPTALVPPELELESIKSAEIPRCEAKQQPCMTDETYVKFGKNNRALKQQIEELRALLGDGP